MKLCIIDWLNTEIEMSNGNRSHLAQYTIFLWLKISWHANIVLNDLFAKMPIQFEKSAKLQVAADWQRRMSFGVILLFNDL